MSSKYGENSPYAANSKEYIEAPFWKLRDERLKREAEEKERLKTDPDK